MLKLPYTTKTTHYVSYNDLEYFIKEVYGFTLDLCAAEEASNDSHLTYDIDGIVEEYDREDIEQLFNGEWVGFGTGRLALTKLCVDGHIPAGNYCVDIFW